MALFNPSRDEVRQFFFESWQKFRGAQALTALESLAVQVMQLHPEYHPVLDVPERFLEQEYFPEMGETNPFLHMSLHLSVLEQLSIDQPPGIASIFRALAAGKGEHDAQHDVMDCLAETIWRAQRDRAPPDSDAYLGCLRKKSATQAAR